MSIDDLKQYKMYPAIAEKEVFYPVADYPNSVRKNAEGDYEGRALKGILQDLDMEEKMSRRRATAYNYAPKRSNYKK